MARPDAAAPADPCTDPQNDPVISGGFEIDGNLCTNNASNSDWDAAGTQPVVVDPVGASDPSGFTSGQSEDSGPNWTVAQSTTPNGIPSGQARSDLSNVYAYANIVGGNVFAYFGFQLEGGTGTMSVHIELNQKPNADPSCLRDNRGVPSPCRTPGDLLLAFDKSGSGPITLTQAWTWSGSAWVPRSVAGVAVGRANNGTIQTLTGGTITGSGRFGEVAVNLTTLFGPVGCSGQFGTVNMRTSASTTLSSALIDWVRPVDLSVPSTCPTVVLQKHWVNGSDGDTAHLAINGATAAPGTATSTADGTADFTDATHQAIVGVEPGSTVNLAETLPAAGRSNTGTYSSTLGCDNGILTPPQPGRSGSFTMPNDAGAGTTITCTFTNTRAQTVLNLTKVWVNSTPGDIADLIIGTGRGTSQGTSTAPASATISTPVFSGEPVTVVEALGNANASSYAATTHCSPNVDNFQPGNFGASFTVPRAPTEITCTITNTAVPAEITLAKEWENGAAGDTAAMTITNVDDPTDTDTAVATVPAGRGVRSTNAARLTVSPGETVTLSETLPAPGRDNAGTYDPTALVCNGNPVDFTTTSTGATASFHVTSSAPVNCVYTNTRQTANLVVRKRWVNGAAGDSTELQVSGSNPLLGPLNAVSVATGAAGGEIDRTNQVTTGVFTGQHITVTETLGGGNTGSYTSSLTCNNGVVPNPDGTFTLPAALADTTVTCTFTNTRHRANLIVRKRWVNGAAGDQAELQLSGTNPNLGPLTATSTASGAAGSEIDAANRIRTGVFAGQHLTVSESLPSGNTGAYTSSLTCDNGVNPDANGQFTLTQAQANTTVTCTFTNTRHRANLIVRKRWVNGAAGDQADLHVSGTNPDLGPLTATSVASGVSGSEIDATNRIRTGVFAGQHITMSESLLPGNTGSYSSSLACVDSAGNDILIAGNEFGGTFTLNAAQADRTITCTFTNTRHRANLIVRKRWVNGAAGDQAGLHLSGTNPPLGPLTETSVASGAAGGEIDATNRIRARVFAGQHLTVSESLLPGNTGTYDSTLACDHGVTPDANGQFTLTAAQADTTVTCTFTNTRHRANLIVRKRWVNGAAGDQADLHLSGTNPTLGPLTETSVASGASGSEIDATNRIRTGVFTGQHLTVSETLLPANTGAYSSSLVCDHGVDPNANGSFTLTAAQADTTVTCTFTNTRQTANLIVRKRWVDGAAGDQADLRLSGTNPDLGPLTETSVASGASGSEIDATNRIRTGVFAGQHLTVTETLLPGNTGTYTSSLACDNGVTPDANGTFTVTAAQADTTVTCTFTNTRHRANLVVRKRWVDGAAGDQADLHLSGTNPALGPLTETSVASGASGGEIDATNRIRTGVFTGQHLTVSETLLSGNTGTYTSSLACDNGVMPDANGQFTLTAAQADTTVTCTFTNSRERANLIVRKRWVNGAAGDQAELRLTGTNPVVGPLTATSVSSGASGGEIDATNRIRTGVFTGQHLTVSESLLSGNTGTYTSSLACDNGVTPDANGTFTLTAAQAETTVTCTFTNTRQTANLIVRKRWVDGAAGDQATLHLSGTNPQLGPLTVTSVASGAAGGEIDPTNLIRTGVFAGQQVTVSESLPLDNTGTYTSSLACDNGVTPDAGGTFTVTAAQADTTVTCTFTNTRHTANLIVRKRWVDGAAGDQATLHLSGSNPDLGPLTATSVATGAAGAEIDATNRIRTGVLSGQVITVSESLLAGNTGSYDSTLVCDNGVTPDAGGTFTVTAAQADTTVTCTFTNTRTAGTVTLHKIWRGGVAGDTAHLTITGAASTDDNTSTVPSPAPPRYDDTQHGAVAQIHSGQTVTVAEALGRNNAGSYDSELVCDNGDSGTTSVTFTVGAHPGSIACTVTNTVRAVGPSETASPSAPTESSTLAPTLAPTAASSPSGPVPLTGDEGGPGTAAGTGYYLPWALGGLVFLATAGGILAWRRRRSA